MLLWKMLLAVAALKGREACAQPADTLRSTSENAPPGMPEKILAFTVAPPGRPVVEGK